VIYVINLAPAVPVCLHCGEIAAEGALFCAKCGFTLPQVDSTLPTSPPIPRSPFPTAPVPGGVPPPLTVAPNSPSAQALPPGSIAAMTGPMAPPPAGKYCIRCRTIISRAAVFCPVCQQPQTP
jgi:RNA polymerase subunit RPABC4/transcription elongation factor Spt4